MEFQWELMIFTLFISLGAGIFALQGFLAFRDKARDIQMPALIASLVSVCIGGIGSFLHLEHWDRIFNGFGHLSSGITQELICVVVFVLALVVYFIMLRRSKDQALPKWCGIMAIAISAVLVVVMALSYNMASRPVWDTPILWLYYLANAFFFGSLTVALIVSVKRKGNVGDSGAAAANDGAMPLVVKSSLISGIVQAVMTAIYAIYFAMTSGSFTAVGNYFDPTLPTKPMTDPSALLSSVFMGEYAVVFWVGVVIVGLLAPIAGVLFVKKKPQSNASLYLGVSLVCALAGGMAFRVVLYVLGISVFMFY